MTQQYKDLINRILTEGEWIVNPRTGVRCLTVINADMEFDTSNGDVPLISFRNVNPEPAVAELIGYLRAFTSAADFRAIGTKTWDANANDNKSWLANSHRTGEDDMGFVYGAVARKWPKSDGTTVDLVAKVYNNLKQGIDDRGETITFWNPGEFERGCLRPCLRNHTFSLINGTLHLTSEQRSNDAPLGCVFNMIQTVVLLRLMAQITGHKSGKVFYKNINVHIYENQIPMMQELVKRECLGVPKLAINPNIRTLQNVEDWVSVKDFEFVDYKAHPAMKIPFTV